MNLSVPAIFSGLLFPGPAGSRKQWRRLTGSLLLLSVVAAASSASAAPAIPELLAGELVMQESTTVRGQSGAQSTSRDAAFTGPQFGQAGSMGWQLALRADLCYTGTDIRQAVLGISSASLSSGVQVTVRARQHDSANLRKVEQKREREVAVHKWLLEVAVTSSRSIGPVLRIYSGEVLVKGDGVVEFHTGNIPCLPPGPSATEPVPPGAGIASDVLPPAAGTPVKSGVLQLPVIPPTPAPAVIADVPWPKSGMPASLQEAEDQPEAPAGSSPVMAPVPLVKLWMNGGVPAGPGLPAEGMVNLLDLVAGQAVAAVELVPSASGNGIDPHWKTVVIPPGRLELVIRRERAESLEVNRQILKEHFGNASREKKDVAALMDLPVMEKKGHLVKLHEVASLVLRKEAEPAE